MNPTGRKFFGLPAETPVARKIAATYPSMSTAQRAFADLVQTEPLHVARLSIHDAVAVAGVSVATANRFATTLGYEGYPEFRADLIRGFEDYFQPVESLKRKREEKLTPYEVAHEAFLEDQTNIAQTSAALTEELLEGAVSRILKARRIYVAGFDLAAHLGAILSIGLGMAGCEAQAGVSGGGSIGAMRVLSTFGPDDLVIAIAFPHYFLETIRVVDYAKSVNIPVISITDGLASPLVPLSDISLFVTANRAFVTPSSTAIMATIEALTAAVASQSPRATEAGEAFASAAWPWMAGLRSEDGA